jgi:hypothetical protein
MMPVTQRLHRRLDDELGGTKIRLADTEIDDVAALRRERRGTGENGESVLFADPTESRDGSQHGRHLNLIAVQKQTLAADVAAQYGGCAEALRETGFARAPDRLIYAGGEGVRRRK